LIFGLALKRATLNNSALKRARLPEKSPKEGCGQLNGKK